MTTNLSQTARLLGVSTSTLSRLLHQGIITPEIRERHLLRFDSEKVRQQLADRAANYRPPAHVNKF